MSLFISLFGGGSINSTTNGAASSTAQGGGGGMQMIIMLFMIVAIFLIMIIPQRRKDKAKKNMLSSVKKGDKIETIGGIRGQVVAVKEQTVIVKLEGDAKIEIVKEAIANILNRKPEDAKAQKNKKGQEDNSSLNITPVRKKDEPDSDEEKTSDTEESEKENEEN